MSKTDQEKIKQAVDLLIDKDTDLTSFFAKDGMLKELTKNLFERALKAEMDELLCARYTSPPLRQMRSPLYTNFFVSYCHPPF